MATKQQHPFSFFVFFSSLCLSPFPLFFGFAFLFAFPLKHATNAIEYPLRLSCFRSVPCRFFRSLDEFSFARLPCVVLSTKKAQSCDNFQVKTERSTLVFLSRKQSCSKWCTQIPTQSIKSTILRVTSVF